ncbi:MAG TPA: glycine betaine ABC transporter substrate-binding protein [Candidatus Dormibacteraeota bacterium]|nr:glycine betaine ABC transporter substrate-binding protein [Candidatus Dormibacteraeota bacterium]
MKGTLLAILAAAIVAPLAACGGGNNPSSSSSAGGGGTCPTSSSATNGNGAHVSIGSKGFAEEQLLATITKLALQKHGFTVDYSLQAKDTAIGDALTSGQIGMLWQYTGTQLQTYLHLTDFPRDLDQAFTFVKQKDEARGLCWVAPAPMNDTNGLAISASMQGTLGSTLSDFNTYLQSHPQTKVCILSEFRTRPDGIPGLVQTYGQGYATGNVNYIDVGSTAEANIKNGQCVAGEVFTTDSPIAANNLLVLKDDKNLFPPDNVGLIVRSNVLKANPAIAAIMTPIAAKITSDVITGLNKKVEIDNQPVEAVAQEWLNANS